MFARLAAGLLFLSLTSAAVWAAPPERIADRVQAILAEYQKELTPNTPPATRRELEQKRDARFAELLSEGKKEEKPQHAALGVVCMHLKRFAEAAEHAEAALKEKPDSEDAYFMLLQALISDKALSRAETRYADAVKKFPSSRQIEQLRDDFFRAYMQLREPGKAVEHGVARIESAWRRVITNPADGSAFVQNVDQFIYACRLADKLPLALEQCEKLVSRAQAAVANGDTRLQLLQGTLLERKIRLLSDLDRFAEADKLLQADLALLAQHLEANPQAVTLMQQKARLLQLRSSLLTDKPEDLKKSQQAQLDFVDASLAAVPKNASIVGLWLSTYQGVINAEIRSSQFEQAETHLAKVNKQLDAISEDADLKPTADRSRGAVRTLVNNLTNERRRFALLGQPALPLTGATWLNGSELTTDDLKGQVVLLDFWAVWCGPCIATFPHLRDWQEKYGDRGLKIIGVTRRYEFDFDLADGRPRHSSGIKPEAEDAATQRFVEYHKLKHRIAVMASDDLSKGYFVTGIPQAVLIDRQGLVRMIRVGSGDANAQALHAAIEKYLGEPASAAAATSGGK